MPGLSRRTTAGPRRGFCATVQVSYRVPRCDGVHHAGAGTALWIYLASGTGDESPVPVGGDAVLLWWFLYPVLWVLCAPLGGNCAWAVSWLARYIAVVAGAIAKIPGAALYTQNRLSAWWLPLTYAVFIVTWLWRKRDRKYRWYVPATISAVALCVCLVVIASVYSSGAGYFTAVDVGQGQSLAAMAGGNTVVIDCGGRSADGNAGNLRRPIFLAAAGGEWTM